MMNTDEDTIVNKTNKAKFHALYNASSSTTLKYRGIVNYYHNKFDTATCIGLNVKLRPHSNTIVYKKCYEFYIIVLKMTILGRNMLPEYSI